MRELKNLQEFWLLSAKLSPTLGQECMEISQTSEQAMPSSLYFNSPWLHSLPFFSMICWAKDMVLAAQLQVSSLLSTWPKQSSGTASPPSLSKTNQEILRLNNMKEPSLNYSTVFSSETTNLDQSMMHYSEIVYQIWVTSLVQYSCFWLLSFSKGSKLLSNSPIIKLLQMLPIPSDSSIHQICPSFWWVLWFQTFTSSLKCSIETSKGRL